MINALATGFLMRPSTISYNAPATSAWERCAKIRSSTIMSKLELHWKSQLALADHPPPTEPTLLQIWEAQSKLGFSNFILRWLSRSWCEEIGFYGSNDPSGHAAQLLTLIWDGLCEPIWACRNDIRTNNPNPKDLLEMSNLQTKLEWYKKFKNEVLPHRLRFLAEYTQDNIRHWDRDRRKTMVRMLDKSKRIYEIEIKPRLQTPAEFRSV
jgi:hypothetical protein